MSSSNFVDYVKIFCRSGKGGAGSKHLHRDNWTQKGGPDGGDGGRGGHVILRGNKNYWTLIHLKYARHVYAGMGGDGGHSRSFGKDGEDKVIEVPCGTVVHDGDSGEFICDITQHDEEFILVKGGRGGQGNWHFRSSTNQTPRYAQPGEPAIEKSIVLQLKVLADVGLVGFPNAGKSTLLSVVSAAKPQIADYPFTTLVPNLGIVSYRNNQSFVMADIPGIIEGASTGKGLGLRFLRHIERNSILLYMIPADCENINEQYIILRNELCAYNQELAEKQGVLAITKCDMCDEEMIEGLKNELPNNIPSIFISSLSEMGITELKDLLWKELNKPINQIKEITHQPLTTLHQQHIDEIDEEEWIDENTDETEDFKGIGWDEL